MILLAETLHDISTFRRSRRLARIIVAFSLVATLSVNAFLAYLAVQEAGEVEGTVERDLLDNARLNVRLIENNLLQVTRIFSGINSNLLRYLPQQVEGNAEIDAFLEKQLALLPMAGNLMVTDADGVTLFWTGGETAEATACPPCVAAARLSPAHPPGLFGPFVGAAAERSDIVIGQRLNDLFGNVIGLVTLTVSAASLADTLHMVTAPLAATAKVVFPERAVLAARSSAPRDTAVGDRVLTATAISPAFGFAVTVAADRSSALEGWHQNNVLRVLVAGLLTLILSALALYAIRQIGILDRTVRDLEDMSRSLRAANATKSNFLANMSHELRTPLNAIIGFADALLSGMFGPLGEPKVPEYLEYIQRSGRHLLTLINDMLDLAKIETGRLDVWPEPADVVALCQECATMLDSLARPRGIGITVQSCTARPWIVGDRRRLRQALLNVIGNAVRYNRDGGTVTVTVQTDDRDVVIVVDDTGIGMTDEELRTAFTRFGHAPSRVTAEYGGTGLGLPISKGIVESHGGTLTLASAKGRGTRTEIRLPADPKAAQRAVAAPIAGRQGTAPMDGDG